jgi:PIN domain nuclease of toxin-antitoxin system
VILLDTHVLIWLDQARPQLGPAARELIQAAFADDALVVSAITFWEVAMLVRKGRLKMSVDAQSWRSDLLQNGLREIEVDGWIGIASTTLRGLPADPADRMIVATALGSGAQLVTADRRLLEWEGTLDRADARH